MCDNNSSFGLLLPPSYKEEVRAWLANDTPKLDWGGFVVGDRVMTASILGKTEGVLAGVPWAQTVFEELGCSVDWLKQEGAIISEAEASSKTPIARASPNLKRKYILYKLRVFHSIGERNGV
jgi:nicotinate-nucleotide pyrophosphorylase (carboxylating)